MPRRDKRRHGRTARDVRRAGLFGPRTAAPAPPIKELDVWLRVNGVDVANSNSMQAMEDLAQRQVVSFSRTVELDAGDYVELMFAVNDLNMGLNAIAADGVNPATPSVVINVTQVE
jgi:hypothetical protein